MVMEVMSLGKLQIRSNQTMNVHCVCFGQNYIYH